MQAIASRYLTPPQVAQRFGIDPSKVINWIRSGELHAINVSTSTGGRPRFRISPSDLAIFEAARSAAPMPKITRCRRRKQAGITEYF